MDVTGELPGAISGSPKEIGAGRADNGRAGVLSDHQMAKAAALFFTCEGQVGVDAQKRLAGDGGFAAQTERAFDNLGAALAHVGGKWSDVAMLTIYVVRYEESQAPVIGQAIRARFAAGKLPACSLVGIQALAEPRFLIEVEAIAVVTSSDRA